MCSFCWCGSTEHHLQASSGQSFFCCCSSAVIAMVSVRNIHVLWYAHCLYSLLWQLKGCTISVCPQTTATTTTPGKKQTDKLWQPREPSKRAREMENAFAHHSWSIRDNGSVSSGMAIHVPCRSNHVQCAMCVCVNDRSYLVFMLPLRKNNKRILVSIIIKWICLACVCEQQKREEAGWTDGNCRNHAPLHRVAVSQCFCRIYNSSFQHHSPLILLSLSCVVSRSPTKEVIWCQTSNTILLWLRDSWLKARC